MSTTDLIAARFNEIADEIDFIHDEQTSELYDVTVDALDHCRHLERTLNEIAGLMADVDLEEVMIDGDALSYIAETLHRAGYSDVG